MRESIGGAMMFYIVIFFFILFIMFLAGITQYGIVFKTKNSIVNFIEQNEGISQSGEYQGIAGVTKKLDELGYRRGYTICCKYVGGARDGNYYSITLNAVFNIMPILPNDMGRLELPVKGDTRLIETGSIGQSCTAIDSNFTEKHPTDSQYKCYTVK